MVRPQFAKDNKPKSEEKPKFGENSKAPEKTKVKIENGTLGGIKTGYEKFLDKVKKSDPSKPAVETENGKEATEKAKKEEHEEHEDELKKAKLESDVKKMESKGSGVDLEKIKALDKKKKEKKTTHVPGPPGEPELKIKKTKDKLNHKVEKESGEDKTKFKLKKQEDKIDKKIE